MLRFVRTGVIVVVLLCMGGGVAAADPVPVDTVVRTKRTADGWDLTLSLSDMSINSVPNMAATAFTREGFLTGTATLTIGNGTSDGIRDDLQLRALSVWAQLGCQIDLTQGLVVNPSPAANLGASGTSNPTGPPTIGVSPSVGAEPQIQVTLQPGTITDQVLGYKQYPTANPPTLSQPELDRVRDRGIVVSVQDFHLKVDKCGGPVSVRLHAKAYMGTADSDDAVDAYSDILPL